MKPKKALNLLEFDLRPLLLLGALHFAIAGAHAMSDIVTTSLLVAHLGAEVLPQVYIGGALLLAGVGLYFIPLIDRMDRSRVFAGTLVFFPVLLAASHHLGEYAPGLVYRALYLLTYLMKGLVFLQFWLIASEVCDLRQAKRLFPLLLGFSLAGGVIASVAASLLPRLMPTEDLLLVAAALMAAALLPARQVARQYGERLRRPPLPLRFRPSQTWQQLKSDLDITLSSPLLKNLSLSVLLFALLAQVLDFLLGKAASLRFVDASGAVNAESLTALYAALNGAVIGAGALLQFFVANRLFSAVGVNLGQMLAPLAFLAGLGSIAMALAATGNRLGPAFFFAVVGSRALQKVLGISVYRSSVDLLYNPTPAERRGRAKAFKETVIEPAGTCLGGLILLGGGFFDIRILILASLALAGLFLYLSVRLKANYLDSLTRVLREKSRFRFEFSSTLQSPPERKVERHEVVSDLDRALADEEVSVRLLAVELAAELREPATAPLLARRFRQEPDPRVRATMIMALGRLLRRRLGSLVALEPSLEDPDPRVRANGIEALAQIGLTESTLLLPPFTRDPEPRIRANTAVALSRLDPDQGIEEGHELLLNMYGSGQEPLQLSALYGLGELGDEKALELLSSALGDERVAVRRRAILGLCQAGRRDAIERLVRFVEEGDGATRHLASQALASCGEAAVDALILALWRSDVEVRRYVVEALGSIKVPRAGQALIHILSLEAEQAYYDLLRLQKISSLPETPGVRLLAESLAERVARAKQNAVQILRTFYAGRRGMRIILSNLGNPDPYLRSSAIEALEGSVDPALLGGILPLFEHSDPKVTVEHAGSIYQLPDKGPLEVLFELAGDPSRWLRACALYALGEVGDEEAVKILERNVNDPYELARLNAIEAIGRRGGAASLTVLERLRSQAEGRTHEYAQAALRNIQARISRPAG